MHNVQDVANWFLKNSKDVTNKKLQKLVYYAYSWFLVLQNEGVDNLEIRLFENKFEAWVHGAVYPSLYDFYKKYGSNCIKPYKGKLTSFSPDEIDILTQVNYVYGRYNGNELESICHQEDPWKNARKGISAYEPSTNPISDKDIYTYYSSRLDG